MPSFINILFLSSLLTTLLIVTSHADTIYKSVDKNGEVTYSSTPTTNHQDTSKINISPPPTQEHVKAARKRHENNLQAAEILDKNRQKRDQQTAEDNRIKHEKQNQLQQQTNTENANNNEQYNYPYYRRGTGIIINPGRSVTRPPVQRPVKPQPR